MITVELTVGIPRLVELVESGSAGYLWDTEALDAGVVKVVEDGRSSLGPSDAIGSASLRQVRLEGVAPGETSMTHRRPWNGEASETCRIRVTAA